MSILEREKTIDYDKAKKQADAIVVATIVGFCGTRALLGQPFSFDLQDEQGDVAPGSSKAMAFVKAAQRWNLVLGSIEEILDGLHGLVKNNDHPDNLTQADIHRAVDWDVAPTRDEISNQGRTGTITGSTGSDAIAPGDRWRRPWNDPVEGKTPEYSGYGAYTGICDDPLRNSAWTVGGDVPPEQDPRYPTKPYKLDGFCGEVDLTANNIDNWSKRYGPEKITAWQFANAKGNVEFGIIHDSNAYLPPVGFGISVAPTGGGKKVFGFVHGMSQAQAESIRTGPWCVSHEHAIGDKTTKLASCFPCTTFMYAAGYPPSSSHLGRGESWVPPQIDNDTPNRKASGELAVQTINTIWAIQIHYYMDLGCKLLQKYFDGDALHHPNNEYRAVVDQVATTLAKFELDKLTVMKNAGNLFLDALVFHDNQTVQLMNVLGVADMSETEVTDIQRDLLEGKTIRMKERRHYAPEWIRVPPYTVKVTNTFGASGALSVAFARKSGDLTLVEGGTKKDPVTIARNANDENDATGALTIVITTKAAPVRLTLEDLLEVDGVAGWTRTISDDQPYKDLSYGDLVYPRHGKYPITYVYTQVRQGGQYKLTLSITVEIKEPEKKG